MIGLSVVAVLGLLVGPLLRLLVDRVPGRLPLRSVHGPHGDLGARALVPVASWLDPTTPGATSLQGSPDDVEEGEERVATRTAWRAPVIDVATSLVLVALTWRFGWTAQLPAMWVFGAALVVVTVIDIDHYRIPDRIVFPSLGACGALLVVAAVADSVAGALVGAAVGSVVYFAFLFLFFVVSPSGMGFGDVKLALLLGMVLGWVGAAQEVDGVLVEGPVVDSFRVVLWGALAGSILGSAIGLGVVVVRGRRAHFPFGPSLCVGALVVVLASRAMLS